MCRHVYVSVLTGNSVGIARSLPVFELTWYQPTHSCCRHVTGTPHCCCPYCLHCSNNSQAHQTCIEWRLGPSATAQEAILTLVKRDNASNTHLEWDFRVVMALSIYRAHDRSGVCPPPQAAASTMINFDCHHACATVQLMVHNKARQVCHHELPTHGDCLTCKNNEYYPAPPPSPPPNTFIGLRKSGINHDSCTGLVSNTSCPMTYHLRHSFSITNALSGSTATPGYRIDKEALARTLRSGARCSREFGANINPCN
jgi:hypothetical protein